MSDTVVHCKICDLETLKRSTVRGICRARVSCHKRFESQKSPTLKRFMALPDAVRNEVCNRLDTQRSIFNAALEADAPLPVLKSWDEIMDEVCNA